MLENFKQKLEGLLKKYSQTKAIDLALKNDKELLGALLLEPALKERFFEKIGQVFVFKQNEFIDYLSDKNFLANSYTKYKNKIGLNIDKKFLNERGEVALVWPFKDCVLEGGATRDEENRQERFFNATLAQDEIDQLFSPKVLTNFKRYEAGKTEFQDFKKLGFKQQENLIIKGNNLLALHSLKQQFQGKIKLIYIDPPYNTGNDSFNYNDNFNHSTWLTFMKNRLEVARDLLRDDGSIFISCDDSEQAYLKVLCDEVFDRDNFLASITWHRKRGKDNSARFFSRVHEFILVYSKNKEQAVINKIGLDQRTIDQYQNSDNDPRGKYRKLALWRRGGQGGSKVFGFITKEGIKVSPRAWLVNEETMKRLDKDDRLVAVGDNLYRKLYLNEHTGAIPETIWLDASNTANASDEIKDFFGSQVFLTPKPTPLIKRIIMIATQKDDIVLDFHAGSGTTAQAVLELNKEDGGNRKFILVEQMDYVEKITVERVKRVLQKENINDSFVYMELMKYNEKFVGQIQKAKTTAELLKIWQAMQAKSFLNFDTPVEKINQTLADFKKLPLKEQKQFLFDLLNKNQLYVPLSSIADTDF
ncbi:MAG: site-specific DNA-methyltransferase, partial [bacterium]|nr:site-specific DNA-methyltransferase [bacterium]